MHNGLFDALFRLDSIIVERHNKQIDPSVEYLSRNLVFNGNGDYLGRA